MRLTWLRAFLLILGMLLPVALAAQVQGSPLPQLPQVILQKLGWTAPPALPSGDPEGAISVTIGPVVTPTATTVPPGQVAGAVYLQGRADHSGAAVRVDGYSALSRTDGSYLVAGIPPGQYSVTITMTGYLPAERQGVVVLSGQTTGLPPVTLLAGDVDGDGEIDVFDLVIIAVAFGSTPDSPRWDPRADVNGDGSIDILDLVLTGYNFGAEGSSLW